MLGLGGSLEVMCEHGALSQLHQSYKVLLHWFSLMLTRGFVYALRWIFPRKAIVWS
jgi:hypothetical protein